MLGRQLDSGCSKPPRTTAREKARHESRPALALWPEIKAALEDGQSFKSIHQWLDEDAGITVSIPGLRSYVSRSRRKEAMLRKAETERAFFRAALSEELQPLIRIERDYSKAQRMNLSQSRGKKQNRQLTPWLEPCAH